MDRRAAAKKHKRDPASCGALALSCGVAFCALACGCSSVRTFPLVAPPEASGALSAGVISRTPPAGDSELIVQSVATLDLDSHVWQPWFAKLQGGAGVSYEKRSGRVGNEGDAIRISGDVALSVLPQSRFPTHVAYSRLDNRVSGEFLGSNFVQNRFSATTTSILTSTFRTNLGVALDWSEQNRLGDRQSQRIFGGATKTFGENFAGVTSISANVDYTDSDFDSTVEGNLSENILTANLAVQAAPAEDLRNQLIVTYIRDKDDARSQSSNRRSFQAVNSFFWTPTDKIYDVDGFIRARLENITFGDETSANSTQNNQYIGVVNVKIPVGERLHVRTGVRAGFDGLSSGRVIAPDAVAEPRRFAAANAAINYYSRVRSWGDYEWRWGARLAAEAGWANEDNVLRKPSGAVNHTLDRTFDLFGPNASRISFTQEVGFDAGAIDRDQSNNTTFTPIATHGVNYTYSVARQTSSTSLGLTMRDLREFAGERDALQTAQLRFNRRQGLDAKRSITGVITLNALRRKLGSDTDTFVTATGRLVYAHRSLFSALNLDFRSEIAVNVFELDELLSDDPTPTISEDLQHHEWRNFITYHIGRIAVIGEASAFYEDEGFGNLFMFRIRRDFGGH